jgi:hypothetical protein
MPDDDALARRRSRRIRLLVLDLTPQLRRSCPETPEAIVIEMARCMAERQVAAEERSGLLRETPPTGLAYVGSD